ncbi:MAG: tRNA (adenosine(37)-N6)-dimethylallyltransferase MiaA [Bacteroidales bacterium]|nr:tRNA (adenosine(37)-N6)-dimethylallyltransferase MiaA [Bacteroidales bacterium]
MKRLIVIVGPTAIGKTATAVRMAQQMHTEIISCDSRQFYNEMNIGVARPSPDELEAAKHHFIACRSVSNPYNVYDFEHDALALLDSLFVNHDTVIAVGGSGLYIDALCKGINLMPDPSPELRNELSSRIANGQLDQLISELKRLDPDYYNVVDLKNPIRIQRALEVIYTSGLPYSQLIGKPLPNRPFEIEKIGLRCQRDTLRQRIYSRVEIMMTQGLLQEAESLITYRHLNTLNTVGYKELFCYFDGKCTLQQAVTDIKNHTWQYAKKQISWFARYNDISWQDIHEN